MNKRLRRLALLAAGLLGTTVASAAGIELSLDSASKAAGSGRIDYHLVNDSASTIHVLRWETPLDGLTADLFQVTLDGRKAVYTGPLYKRVAPRPEDYIELKPGQSIDAEVDLSAWYDMREGGRFEVRYARDASDVVLEASLASKAGVGTGVAAFDTSRGTIQIYVDAAPNPLDSSIDALGPSPLAATNSFVSCSNTRQSQLVTARGSAGTYANNSKAYLDAGTVGTRYTWWFGTYTSSRYATVRSHFANIASALSSQPYTFNCSCTDSGTYAYVYPTQPYKVYLCGAFWSAPNTGTDSRAGTLVHETSHFNVVAGTGDYGYGQTNAHNLATSNPAKAVTNADNHEYFAENNPARN